MQQKLSRGQIKTINENHVYYVFLLVLSNIQDSLIYKIDDGINNVRTESSLVKNGFRILHKTEPNEDTGISSLEVRYYFTNDCIVNYLLEVAPAHKHSWTKVIVGRLMSQLATDSIDGLHYILNEKTGKKERLISGGVKIVPITISEGGRRRSIQVYNFSEAFIARLLGIKEYALQMIGKIKKIKSEIADNGVRYTEETTNYIPTYFSHFLSIIPISTDREILWQDEGDKRGIYFDERTQEFCFETRLFIQYVINMKCRDFVLTDDDITELKKNLTEELDTYELRPRGIRLKETVSKSGKSKQIDCAAIWRDTFHQMAGTKDIIILPSDKDEIQK